MCNVCNDPQCHWGEYCHPEGRSVRVRVGKLYQHKKTRGTYRVIECGKIEKDLTPCVIYVAEDNTVWVRPTAEFLDGRFVEIDDVK